MQADSPYCPKSPPKRRSLVPATHYVTESKFQFTAKTTLSPEAPRRAASLTQPPRPSGELTLDGILRSPYSIRRQGHRTFYRGSPLQATLQCFNKRSDEFSKWGELLLNRGVQVKSHYL